MTDIIHFEGTCDVCGEKISHDYHPSEGIIDFMYEEETERMITWIRHYATAPPGANQACAIYSSRVYEVKA